MKAYVTMKVALHAFLTSALPAGRGPASRSGCFITKARVSGVHWLRRLLEPRVNLAGGGGGVPGEEGNSCGVEPVAFTPLALASQTTPSRMKLYSSLAI